MGQSPVIKEDKLTNRAPSRIKLNHSIVIRFAFFFTLLLLSVVLIVGYLLNLRSEQSIRDFANERLQQSAKIAENAFYNKVEEIRGDGAALLTTIMSADGNFLQPSILSAEEKDLLSLISGIKDLKDLKIIGNEGEIRYQYSKDQNGSPYKVARPGPLEQDAFVKEVLIFENYDYHFSDITLNTIEGSDKIIKIAAPLISAGGRKNGHLIAEFSLKSFFDELNILTTDDTEVLLVDGYGQYILADHEEKEFGLLKGTGFLFKDEFRLNTEILDLDGESLNSFTDANDVNYLNFVRSIDYSNGRKRLFLLLVSKESDVLLPAKNIRKQSLRIVLILSLLSILAVFFFTRFFVKNIQEVTDAITNFEAGKNSSLDKLQSEKNEIGLLARSFKQMQNTIDLTIDQLQNALKKEQQAKREKDEFLQNMSHEMRTPLHAILGLTSILRKNNPTQSQEAILSSLERSTKNLSGLLYDVLDFRKLSHGELTLSFEPTHVVDLIKDAYDVIYYEGIAKGLDMELSIDPSLGVSMYNTDGLRLSQILNNIFINAVKYTSQGFVKVRAKYEDQLWVVVEDSGIGIQEENLEKLNERYFREDQHLTGRFGDYGLGLAIVKQLLALFNGELKVQSEKGKGSVFTIGVPMSPSQLKTEDKKPNISGNEYPTPCLKHVLLIEDDLISAELAIFALNTSGFLTSHIGGLSDLYQSDTFDKTDLIITDLQVGNTRINEEQIWDKIVSKPFVVTSGYHLDEYPMDIEYVLTKPFSSQALLDNVHALSCRERYGSPDWSNLYQNYDNNAEMIRRVLGLILEEIKAYLAEISLISNRFDLEIWHRIKHKLITHARDMKLKTMISILETDESMLSTLTVHDLSEALKHLACFIRIERQKQGRD